ncbi:MAG TPA: c-type cytochrome, partial [Steroidobacteraceae bacterium]|nr:c-type cytochrome [Steroidobacteraceae bacterium]
TIPAFVICSVAFAADAVPTTQQAAEKLASTTCAACHGKEGRNTLSPFPNLAAQSGAYVEGQLKAFRDQKRADPDAQAYMWGMASQLNDSMINALAVYYAAQHPAPGKPGTSKLVAKGKLIFEKGMPEQGIPACNGCHGANAEGNGIFPRLAGPHAPYMLKQILLIQNALRVAPVMHGLIKDLSRDDMLAVTTYLESAGQP